MGRADNARPKRYSHKGMKQAAILIVMMCSLALSATAKQRVEIESQWRGARVAYLGDSITETRQVEQGLNDTYWLYLERLLGTRSAVYGISGHEWRHIPGQTDRLIAERGEEIDAIMIFVGTNDFNKNVPLGEWFSEEVVQVEVSGTKGAATGVVAERKQRTILMDGSTLRGRINIAMSKLKEAYPTKQIILLTPLHRGDAFLSDRNIQPDERYANGIGEYIDAYVEVVKEAGNVWAVPVIDMNAISGLYPLAEANAPYWRRAALESDSKSGRRRRDRLHPNGEGHLRMARCLAYQLLGYPAKLD